jgi:Fe-S oxidoreductase/nitrate reductase gamma subunit
MLSPIGKIIFSLVIITTFIAFALPVYYRIKIIRSGQPDKRFNNLAKRIGQALSKILLQRCTLKNERLLTGFMHVFIFYGALTFDTMTINHSLEGFFSKFYLFGNTNFGLFFSFLVDMFAILVIAGVLFFYIKRFIIRPEAYKTTLIDSAIIYIMLTLITLSYLYFEIFAIAIHPETERLSFLGGYFAGFIQNLSSPAILNTHLHIAWWLHILLVFGFIAYVPHSKYFHMFAGSFNLLVNSDIHMGELRSMDIENAEVFGVEKASDYTWKDLLDTFACMECGRCQDVCPAFSSEKALSPKMIIFNLKKHLLKQGKKYISNKKEEINPLMESTFSQDEIWTCTTCGACMHVCPVEIEHIPKIIGLRQSQVLMESKFPGELNSFFRNIETNSNPWGIGFSDRAGWKEGLDIKLISDHPEANYLFWVGCAGSFDEEGKKIARAMATILNIAGIDFAILGVEEKCCGDSAKRLGNEYLFQLQAAENIELFKKYSVKKIITMCPHGYNTFKNEYPGLLDVLLEIKPETKKAFKQIEVTHYTQLLAELIQKDRLPIKQKMTKDFTYHDSCYLGRHNNIISQPRKILSKVFSSKLIELKNNCEHSFCCGAGGGLMWTEESSGLRINHLRTDEVIDSNAELAITSCPFCQTMLQDGLKDKDREDIKVKDIVQLIAESLT